jgi:hypothetical protein
MMMSFSSIGKLTARAFSSEAGVFPAKVTRVYLNSTRREDVRPFFPSDAGGIVSVTAVRLSADRKTYAYSYYRILSDLYVVDGLR